MNTVAIFSTYAPSEGFGGPARIYHERRVLEAAGFDVVHVVLQAKHDSGSSRRSDFVRTIDRPYGAPIDHIYHDVDLARRAAAHPKLVGTIVEHLRVRDVGVIVLEQPFLVDIVATVADSLRIPVIYSCQNIEYRLRADLERFQFDWKRPTNRADEVRELEVAAIELAAAVTAICPTDQQILLGEFGCESTLVPNGSVLASLPSSRSATAAIDFAFAGSSYWPNLDGFARIADPSLAFLPPTTRVHVAGSVGGQLLGVPSIDRHHSANASRLVLRGFLQMDELFTMMRSARAVLVPVFIGEGSNLKSADALASRAPVIMTERATRGYEDVLEADSAGVTVVSHKEEFRAAMSAALQVADHHDASIGRARASMLTWSVRLNALVDLIHLLP